MQMKAFVVACRNHQTANTVHPWFICNAIDDIQSEAGLCVTWSPTPRPHAVHCCL